MIPIDYDIIIFKEGENGRWLPPKLIATESVSIS